MLSGLLRNDIAVQVSINIINAFVIMRHLKITILKRYNKENDIIMERIGKILI